MKQDIIDVYAMRVEDGIVYRGKIEKIENSLEKLQDFVGGLITVAHFTQEIDIVLNDEGKLNNLPLNRVWKSEEEIFDILVGNIFCCRYDEEGNFSSILEEDIPIIQEMLIPIIGISESTIYLNLEENLPVYKTNMG
ncbi:MAG: DUF3846 domain-containing protein [Lachnospiraceae bacterium]|jgi:hypothetical protein|nr:DUF3846 domain-containing protein [Lachnospiraceae bacterium]